MNKKAIVIGTLVTLNLTSVYASQQPIEIPIDTLLAPTTGFEEKNNVQAVVSGFLPNFCYSLGGVNVEKDLEKHEIRIKQFANKQFDGICADESKLGQHMQMAIPFTNEISIGIYPREP